MTFSGSARGDLGVALADWRAVAGGAILGLLITDVKPGSIADMEGWAAIEFLLP